MVKSLTISRLALNILVSTPPQGGGVDKRYNSFIKIPEIKSGSMYRFIRESLYGGITTVFIPYGETWPGRAQPRVGKVSKNII